MSNSRLCAFDILYGILSNDAYSNIALDKALDDVDSKDKPFVTALVYGVVERKLTLEYLIKPYLKGKTKAKVKLLLLIGAYQLYFMDKIPSRAAINETVALAQAVGASYYKGLINAVLHKIDQNRIDIDKIEDLSIRFSCPMHLINMWKKQYGEDNTMQILSSINEKPPVFAVPNTTIVDIDECLYELNNAGIEGEIDGDVIKINSSFDLNTCKPFIDGLFHIEDMSSYDCAYALNPKENETVLDVCAAPGGKTFTMAELMNNSGKIISCDIHPHRVELIKIGAKRLTLTNIECVENDASIYNNKIGTVDKVLCDVPCSGFGIIRRKPEIRYKELDSVKDLPDIQYNILSVSSKYLKKGGLIVYSTCTLNKKENEKVVKRFFDNNDKFKLVKEKTAFPSENSGDGFYYAVMTRNDD